MKVAVIGAAGRTGLELVDAALRRGWEVAAVCRTGSAGKLAGFTGRDGFSLHTASVVSDPATLLRALQGCDAAIAVLISVRQLRATELVDALAQAAAAHGLKRLVFTAGEITVEPEADESFTFRQRLMRAGFLLLTLFTPYSLADMIRSAGHIRRQAGPDWTIVRAATLTDGPETGYRLCRLDEVTAASRLSRKDYAACLLDTVANPGFRRRTLTVVAAAAA